MIWSKNNQPGWYGSKLNDYRLALQSSDYSAIPWIFCVFAENHDASKTVAADILCATLQKMTFDDLVRVDEQMRRTTSMGWSIDWKKLSVDSFFTPKMSKEARRAVIAFASFNPNGFIRERAVRMMKDYPGTLPFVILRQNDWVSQVRDAARDAAEYRLSHLTAGELPAALPFADKLSRSKRTQNADLHIHRLYRALTSKDNEKELFAALNADSIRIRRICVKALLTLENPRYDLAIDRLKYETDPFLRASIFRELMSTGQDLHIIAERFLQDKYPPNCILAFQYICNAYQDKALQVAYELLLAKSAVVRENARFYINNNAPGFDYRAYYKAHLEDCTASAILGLGETGAAEDCNEIEKYLTSSQIAIVRAAMIAVMRLNSAKYAAVITGFLSDSRVGIVKTARNLIIKIAAPDYAKVMEIFRATPYANTKQKCFSILLTAGKWRRLGFILEVLENGGDEMTEAGKMALQQWIGCYNRSYAVATASQIEAFTKAIDHLGSKLPENTKHQLLFLLR